MLENITISSTDPVKIEKSEIEAPPDIIVADPPEDTTLLSLKAVNKKTEVKKPGKAAPAPRLSRPHVAEARRLRMQCGQLCASVFFDERAAVRSLGFTSAIDGEGKSFLATLAALVMAMDHNIPVTLLECNWEHPCFNDIFSLEQQPGLAEWLRGECQLEAIRQPVSSNLTVIRAGDGKQDTIRLLQQLRYTGVLDVLKRPDEVLIVDLPSIVTTAYGPLAASIVESLVVVLCMGVTSDSSVADAFTHLKGLRIHGVILNQIKSRMPRWLRRIL